MVLWTIQRAPAWDELRTTGILLGRAERVPSEWRHAYAWMREQMVERVGPPPEPDDYPVWAWSRYNGAKKPKPDLRCRGHLETGTAGVRIEVECDEAGAVLSDFFGWHTVLNRHYLPASEVDDDEFDAALKTRELGYNDWGSDLDLEAKVKASWGRILDVRGERPVLQATVWQVKLADVRDVTPFVSR